ncbi:M20/M25/M40 family metallo-hydrolase [Nocardioides nitrophenolicus]|uniref:M20/M25/M40 family metallo-hydrolase n=1 Tax=Nocardioides nitrophenolicus TaxID=60489 RepID=UPI00195AD013|nr:M20/M25/M40 family metallo-hydrolase [Nocardioides nitrophenolicus]MBM7517013.1 acetylornithine deacetylase/succinyl-diaminopimelate desuccinylase-like protein [Nocardioides nitrophenolicus]
MLDATPAPRGRERRAAQALAAWCAEQWPAIEWTVQPYGADGANLVARCGPGPLLYSHLDTSLDDPVGVLEVGDGVAEGFGLGVARAPAAAALAAFAQARHGTLLLAGSGTHRRGGRAEGVRAFLADLPALPPAAIVAKGGPPGLLWEEPGAAYVEVRVSGRPGAALAPESATPTGGIGRHAGLVLDAIAVWRERYLASRAPVGQVGPQVGVGAVRAGMPDKPDLLPADLLVDLYVVTVPGERDTRLGTELTACLHALLADGPLAGCRTAVDVEWLHDAQATPERAPVVRAARHAWEDVFGTPPAPVARWTGSTDGVVLREHGIPTVRVGPQSVRSASDPRRDVVDLADLAHFQRLYEALLEPGHRH